MRRTLQVTAVVLGCHSCGEQLVVPTHDSNAIAAWNRAHLQPCVLSLVAQADCECG